MMHFSNPFRIIDVYTSSFPFATFYNNPFAYQDITFLFEVIKARPVFEWKKKKSTEVVDTSKIEGFVSFLEELLIEIMVYLGIKRREEWKREQSGEEVHRKAMDVQAVLAFFRDPLLQKHFIHLSKMSVGGFIKNYIRDHIREPLRNIWMFAMKNSRQSAERNNPRESEYDY